MNVGVIGCGVMGALHAEIAHRCGAEVVACMDVLPERADALARVHGAGSYTSYDAFFGDERIDAVVVSSPTYVHTEHILAACDSGKHVFCETPLTRTHAEAKTVRAAADHAAIKLFAGHMSRYFHALEALLAQVEADKIGTVGFIKTYRAGASPRGQGDWYRDFEQSGGVVLEGLVHDFDWLLSGFGPITRVYCQRLDSARSETLDYAMATCTFESGLIAQSIGSWAHPGGHRVTVELAGDHGIAQYDSADAPLQLTPRGDGGRAPGVVSLSSPTDPGPYERAWRDFISWVENGTAPRASADAAVDAVRIAEAALASSTSGEPVVV